MTGTRLALLILIVYCLAGCNNKKTQKPKKELILKGIELKVNSVLNPTRVTIFDSMLIVNESYRTRTDKSIKIFSLNDFRLIANTVCVGRGPGELSNPASMVFDDKNRIIWYSDWGKYKCFKFPIDSLVSNPDYKPTESFVIEKGIMPMLNAFFHQSGNIGYTSFNLQENLISFLDTNGKQLPNIAIPKKIFGDFWKDIGISDNPILINYNSDKELIVVASRFTDDIACIDEKGLPVFQIGKLEIKDDPDWSMSKGSDYMAFYQIDSDERFIYCLYAGGYMLRYDKKLNRGVMNYPNRLLVFNWTGTVKYDIKLDHPLMSFSLDKKRKRIIGSTKDFENGLVAYDLSMLY